MNWGTQVTFNGQVVRGDRRLSIVIAYYDGKEKWIAAAVEGARDVTTLDQVFDDHGHATIGSFDTITKAFARGEKFAREWLKSGSIKKCTCDEIGTKKKGARK